MSQYVPPFIIRNVYSGDQLSSLEIENFLAEDVITVGYGKNGF